MFSAAVIAEAVVVFLVGLVVHIFWWRLRRPRNDVAGLFLCLILLPMLVATGRALFAGRLATGESCWLVVCGTVLLASALGCAYIVLYPGAQAASPSMLILLRLAERGRQGMTREELLASLDEKVICDATVSSLVDEQFAQVVGNHLVPGSGGTLLVRVCQRWRALLGLPEGEG